MKKYAITLDNGSAEVLAHNKTEALAKFKAWIPNRKITIKDVYKVN